MNGLMCFLTGGHKYADENIESELIPDDTRHIILLNACVKCGQVAEFVMDVDAQIKHDMANLKEGAE